MVCSALLISISLSPSDYFPIRTIFIIRDTQRFNTSSMFILQLGFGGVWYFITASLVFEFIAGVLLSVTNWNFNIGVLLSAICWSLNINNKPFFDIILCLYYNVLFLSLSASLKPVIIISVLLVVSLG